MSVESGGIIITLAAIIQAPKNQQGMRGMKFMPASNDVRPHTCTCMRA